MSRHVSRKERWTQQSPLQYTSPLGKVVYQRKAWWALLDYKTLLPPARDSDLPTWETHHQELGPYKRPRNAMVALERETTMLHNRHGDQIRFGDELWADAGG